jgi:hypothetical protein
MSRAFAKIRQPRLGFVVEHDPRRISADRDHPSPADFAHRVPNSTETVILARTVTVLDSLARANVVDALAGAGAPVGVVDCVVEGARVTVRFDADRTPADIIDLLIAIEMTAPTRPDARPRDLAEAITIASRGLADPALDSARIIETFLP